MSQAAQVGSPLRRRRALMGLLDADGWTWASVKAFGWFLLFIVLLAYIPDRAYYFTVNKTVDVGLLAWSPVNFCPPENETLPCPVPAGAVVPWAPNPVQLNLPAPRTSGAVAQVSTKLIYIGGTDGTSASVSTSITDVAHGSFSPWTSGPDLPAARTDAAAVVIGSTIYVLGGNGPDGKATDTVWTLTYDQDKKTFGTWTVLDTLKLPEARAAMSAVPVSDGLVVAGGLGPDGSPTTTVWKSNTDAKGALGDFATQPPLPGPMAHAAIAQIGDFIWVWGGSDAKGPSAAIVRGSLGTTPTPETPAPNATPAPLQMLGWATSNTAQLPAPRSAAAGFAANGSIYVAGGDDGTGPKSELYWTVPSPRGDIGTWQHLAQTDLPAAGLEGASAIVSGSTVFIVGGKSADGVLAGSIRANLAPQPPFFQVGLVGAVVPALTIPGEIGQQLGYLSAAGAGSAGALILILIGWAYAHPTKVRAFVDRRRHRKS